MIPQIYFDKVKKYFNGDEQKTWEWFKRTHFKLGMLSPLNALKLGRENKVINIIETEMR